MQQRQTPDGTLFVLEKGLDSRTKWLFLLAALVFIGPAVSFIVLLLTEPVRNGTAWNWLWLLVPAVSIAIATRFFAAANRTDTLLVGPDLVTLSRQKGWHTQKQLFEIAKIGNWRFLDKPVLSDHALATKTFDYLGFQTQQQLINEMDGDNRVAFDVDDRTISFGRRLYSWDFDAIQEALNGISFPNASNVTKEVYEIPTLQSAHTHSIHHEIEIKASERCGCFYCLEIIKPVDIIEWTDDELVNNRTALCPHCGIDAIIGDASAFPVTDPEFLSAMHRYYF